MNFVSLFKEFKEFIKKFIKKLINQFQSFFLQYLTIFVYNFL